MSTTSPRTRLARIVLPLILGCSTLLPTTFAADTSKAPDVADFFSYPTYSNISLSPSGKSLAALVPDKNGRLTLATLDTQNLGAAKIIASYSKADITNVRWVNDERLVYSLTDRQVEPGEIRSAPGLFAINRDGSNPKQLVETNNNVDRVRKLLPYNTSLMSVIPSGDSDEVLVLQVEQRSSIKRSTYNLLRLNTVTGKSVLIQRPGTTIKWLIDKMGVPRIAVTLEDNTENVFYKDPASDTWRKIYTYDSSLDSFNPLQFGADGKLYVAANNGQDTKSLYRFDLSKNALEAEPVLSLSGYDFSGQLDFDLKTNKLLGVTYESDASGSLWFDDEMKALQQKIDKLFPNTVNLLKVRSGSDVILIHSYSDVDPGTYRLFQRSTGKVTPVGRIKPKIDPAQMANMDMVRYPARDGMQIPAYLTLPKGGGKNLPLVLMVHGGPNVRGVHWEWEPVAQFLASRGYAVLEPEFRGSTGYGTKHERAGWKQWGLAMQDDLVDAVKWAVAQGHVDPKRVCIAGASYGGYATLMGLIRDPELFQCGISWVGVSDINLLYDSTQSDMVEEGEKYTLPLKIGDQKKDAAQFKATSPLEQAARLKLPLILAYGGEDSRVPLEHGTKFYNAVKGHNQNVEWIVYPNEGHGWRSLKNNVDFWTRSEKFLNKYIGKGAAAK